MFVHPLIRGVSNLWFEGCCGVGNGEAGYGAGRGVGIVGDVEAAAYKVGIRYLFRLPVREYMMFFSTVSFATCDEHAFALDVNFH